MLVVRLDWLNFKSWDASKMEINANLMKHPCNVWALRIWQHENFSLKDDNVGSTPICVWKSSISCSNEVNIRAPKKRSSQVPLLALQLSCTTVPAIDFCSLREISAHFHVEKGPHFCYLADFISTWKCALNRRTTRVNCWFVLGTMIQLPT